MANLSNINNYFIVDTAGQVAIGDVSSTTLPTLQTQLTVYDHTGTAGIIIQSGGGKKYELFSNASGTFGISDIGVGDRLTISSGGDATFAGEVQVRKNRSNTAGVVGLSIQPSDTTAEYGWRIDQTSNNLNLDYVNTPLNLVSYSTTGNATFTGDITIGGKTYPKLNLTDNQGVARTFSVGTSNETFTVRNETAGSDAFTISNANNATFAESIGLGGATIANSYRIEIAASGGNIIRSTRGTSVFAAYQSNNSDVYLGTTSNNTFKIITNDATAITIGSNKGVQLNGYGSGSFTGTTAYTLAVDSNGNIIETTDGGGTVKGTGTATRVAFWSASDTISSNANLYWDNSNDRLGIGTTSPASVLQVHGTVSYGTIRISPTSTNGESAMGFFMDTAGTTTGTAWIVGQGGWANQGDFVIGNQAFGGPVILAQQDGNVGIGTSSPGNKLHVKGDFVSIEDPSGGYKMELSADTDPVTIMSDNLTGAAYGQIAFVAGNGSGSNDKERMRINSSGNVAINTTTTTEKLRVQGDSGSDLLVRFQPFTNNATSKLYLSSVSSGDGGYFYNSNDNSSGLFAYGDYTFYVGTSNISGSIGNARMIIKQAGNVGIGLTNPDSKLYVKDGHIKVEGNATDTVFFEGVKTGTGVTTKIYNNSNGTYWDSYAHSVFRANQLGGSGGSMVFMVPNEAMRINSNSMVGIGTTGPTTRLSVSDGAAMYADNNYLVQIKRNATNSNDDTSKSCILLANNSNAFQIAYGGTTDRLRFINGGGVEQMTLLNGGNVGIGEINPDKVLHLKSSGATGIAIESTTNAQNLDIDFYNNAGAAAGRIRYEEGTGAFAISSSIASPNAIYITNGNLVGIGETSPGQKLEVDGNVKGDTAMFNVLNNSANSANIIYRSGTTTIVGGGSSSNKLYVLDNGDVGVNDSSPSYKLDADGTIRATGDVIAYSDRRVKENIKTIDNALDKVLKLRGVSYNRKDIDDKSTKIGVIAQEVLETIPEVVEKDLEDKYSVAYGNMAGLFIEAIKELKAEIEELKKHSCDCKK